jgi:nitronate monooxygenase
MASGGFAGLVGCRLPIQLASLGGPIGTPALAAAVSEAGGLGMLPNPRSAIEVEQLVGAVRARTTKPVGVGFLIPFVVREAVEAAGAAVEVVEFFYGEPDAELVRVAKRHGAVVGWQVGSAGEAAQAVAAGCDYVVAQGIEAGGHVRGTQALDDVLRETIAVVDVPIVAAGGVGSAARVAALLDAGASGVRVGTRFVAAEESNAHPDYVARLIAASRDDTVLTETFSDGWPGAPHRVLRTAAEAAERLDRPASSAPPTRRAEGEIAAMALYAGESVDAIHRVEPAADIVAELAKEL